MSKIRVIGDCGRIVYDAHGAEALRLVAIGQAEWAPDHRAVHLTAAAGKPGHGRTRTSRGGLLAAIGRSQCYTTVDQRGQVDGFKRLRAEDRDLFNAATLDAVRLAPAPRPAPRVDGKAPRPVLYIDGHFTAGSGKSHHWIECKVFEAMRKIAV